MLTEWSGRRDSNPRHPAWEAGVLPLNPVYYILYFLMAEKPVPYYILCLLPSHLLRSLRLLESSRQPQLFPLVQVKMLSETLALSRNTILLPMQEDLLLPQMGSMALWQGNVSGVDGGKKRLSILDDILNDVMRKRAEDGRTLYGWSEIRSWQAVVEEHLHKYRVFFVYAEL